MLVEAEVAAWWTARRQGTSERKCVRGLFGAQWRVGWGEEGVVREVGIHKENAKAPGCGEGR